jgi:hypothetical protein
MGTDNLHHKRKAQNQMKRQNANKRKPYDRVLIVCEDSKSVPDYLKAVRDDLKLNIANIVIRGEECGSAPISVIKYAKQFMKEDRGYDKVYCVIDQDQHPKFQETLQEAKDNKITAIISIPCFEYWLLLHFDYITKPFQAAQGSHCQEVIKVLKNHWSNYEKGKDFLKKHYSELLTKQNTAIQRAKQREMECQYEELLENKNPSTQMYLLIEYLNNLKQSHINYLQSDRT